MVAAASGKTVLQVWEGGGGGGEWGVEGRWGVWWCCDKAGTSVLPVASAAAAAHAYPAGYGLPTRARPYRAPELNRSREGVHVHGHHGHMATWRA